MTSSTPPHPPAPKPAARLEVLATLAIVLGLLGVLAARAMIRRLGPHPTEQQCVAMLERYAEQQARAADQSPPDAGRGAASTAEIARCTRDLTTPELDCAMRSSNADELERCLP